MKIEIDIDREVMESLVRDHLIEHYQMLKQSLEDRKQGDGIALYSRDPVEDAREIQKVLESFDSVIEYFSEPDFYQEFCEKHK